MLTLTYPHETWAHRLPAGVKLVALGLWTAALFAMDSLPPIAAATAGDVDLSFRDGQILTFGTTSAGYTATVTRTTLVANLQTISAGGDVILTGNEPTAGKVNFVLAGTITPGASRSARLTTTVWHKSALLAGEKCSHRKK